MNAHQQLAQHSLRKLQRGVNLVEIMVAMVIGLFLVLGATTLYVNTKKTSDVDDSIARLQETARYAMSVIEDDVRMSNYYGLLKGGAAIENKNTNSVVPNAKAVIGAIAGSATVACGVDYASDVEEYIGATNNGYLSNPLYSIGCSAWGAAVSSADTLTVRRVEVSTAAASNTQVQVCSTRNSANVTKSTSATCPAPPVGEFHNLVVNGYYVDQQSTQSTTYPSLRRKRLIDGPFLLTKK